MKERLLFAAFTCLLFIACSKSTLSPPAKPEPVDMERTTGAVYIDGVLYPTITIGNREWMTVNYNGEGGIECPGAETDTISYGKLYTEEEAKAIELPLGWRLPQPGDFVQLMRREIPGYTRGDTVAAGVIERYMAKKSWLYTEGTNLTGFKLVAAGRYAENAEADTIHYGIGTTAVFLMTDTNTIDTTYRRGISIEKLTADTKIKMTDIIPKVLYRDGNAYTINNRYTLRFVRDKITFEE